MLKKLSPGLKALAALIVLVLAVTGMRLTALDREPPRIEIMALSRTVKNGGCAAVVIHLAEENPGVIRLFDSAGGVFFPAVFRTNSYYLCLFACPAAESNYSLWVIASDTEGNCVTNKIPVVFEYVDYPKGRVELKGGFGNDKLAEMGLPESGLTGTNLYAYVQSCFLAKTAADPLKLSLGPVPAIRGDFRFPVFLPLAKPVVTSGFGKTREYYFKCKKMKQSTHYGVDMIGTLHDTVLFSAAGEVVFAGYNGGWGNTAIVGHGYGLYTLYAHCSEVTVTNKQAVFPGESAGYTGATGEVEGEHLHFGVMVQGVWTDGAEWMNPEWVERQINSVLGKASAMITARTVQ